MAHYEAMRNVTVSSTKSVVMLRSETVKYDATRSVSHYESVGRGFESLSAYHLKSLKLLSFRLFSYFLTEFEILEF